MKTGGVIIRGTMLYRDDDEIRVVTGWPPAIRIRIIPMEGVDLKESKLPE